MTSYKHYDNIIVTRPNPWNERLAHKLSALGLAVKLFPCIDLKPLSPPHIQTTFDIIIFTSPAAVLFGHTLAHLGKKIAAIGSGTQQQLFNKAIQTQIFPSTPPFNSEALLEQPGLQPIDGQTILIVTGKNARDLLEKTLKKRSAIVTTAVVYERTLPSASKATIAVTFDKNENNLVVCTSLESLNNLCVLTKKANVCVFELQLMVISQKMAAHATALGFKKPPIIADSAQDAAILAKLETE